MGGGLFVVSFAVAPIGRFMMPGVFRHLVFARVRLDLKIPVPVSTPRETRPHAIAADMANMCRDIADSESDAAIIRPVWLRTVNHHRVVERELTGL